MVLASAVLRVKRENDRRSVPRSTLLSAGLRSSVVITAAANKLARIAWAVLSSGQDYRAVPDAKNRLSKINQHRHQVPNQGLYRITKTNEQFPTACSQPAPENGLP